MYGRTVKRLVDVCLASILLIIASPIVVLSALAIYLEDRGDPIFRQIRVGRAGQPFVIYKLRSMPLGSAHVPSAAAGALRVTRVGKFIRRTNIDELPQLWNIVRGDMSLIGPRPALPTQATLVAARIQRGVLSVRPGLTGLAQVNAYEGMPETEKLEWESKYVASVSFFTDLRILFRTFGYLLRRPPAY